VGTLPFWPSILANFSIIYFCVSHLANCGYFSIIPVRLTSHDCSGDSILVFGGWLLFVWLVFGRHHCQSPVWLVSAQVARFLAVVVSKWVVFRVPDFLVIRKGLATNFFGRLAAGWLLEFPEFLCLIFDPSDSIDLSSDLTVLDIFFGAHTSHLPSFNTLNNNGFHEESEEEGTGTHY
jgi:hypothetical protein